MPTKDAQAEAATRDPQESVEPAPRENWDGAPVSAPDAETEPPVELWQLLDFYLALFREITNHLALLNERLARAEGKIAAIQGARTSDWFRRLDHGPGAPPQ